MDVIKDVEAWATSTEQEWHKEALMTFGEKVIIRRKWTVQDLRAGRTTICVQCQGTDDAEIAALMSDVYKDSADPDCPGCYGTGYDGGFEPVVYIMHILAADDADERTRHRTGQYIRDNPRVQFLWTPVLEEGDLMIKGTWDGDTMIDPDYRYVLSTVTPQSIRTGPAVSKDPALIVAQTADVSRLPPEHPYYAVPLEADGEPTPPAGPFPADSLYPG